MTSLNGGFALLVLAGALLCARAFVPHLRMNDYEATGALARGLILCALGTFPRVAVWDVIYGLWGVAPPSGLAFNIPFHLLILAGLYYILKARWLSLPERERDRYNIITAVFYPDDVWMRPKR